MRIWSLHPQYLDPKGLVALWRETLLAQAVLRGETRGYQNHPQLNRFRQHSSPLVAIAAYLEVIHSDAARRGYNFDQKKIGQVKPTSAIPVTSGQVEYEWKHLLTKLGARSPSQYHELCDRSVSSVMVHPIFEIHSGGIESWERV